MHGEQNSFNMDLEIPQPTKVQDVKQKKLLFQKRNARQTNRTKEPVRGLKCSRKVRLKAGGAENFLETLSDDEEGWHGYHPPQ